MLQDSSVWSEVTCTIHHSLLAGSLFTSFTFCNIISSWFMVQNVPYWNGPPSHMTLPFEYQTSLLSGIRVFSIQIVTVYIFDLIDQINLGPQLAQI